MIQQFLSQEEEAAAQYGGDRPDNEDLAAAVENFSAGSHTSSIHEKNSKQKNQNDENNHEEQRLLNEQQAIGDEIGNINRKGHKSP